MEESRERLPEEVLSKLLAIPEVLIGTSGAEEIDRDTVVNVVKVRSDDNFVKAKALAQAEIDRRSSPDAQRSDRDPTRVTTIELPTHYVEFREGVMAIAPEAILRFPLDDELHSDPARDFGREVKYVSLSANGAAIATRRAYDSRIFVVDAATRRTLSSFKPDDRGEWFELSPSGTHLATCSRDNRSIEVHEIKSWTRVHRTREVSGDIWRFTASPDGKLLVICHEGGILVWSFVDGSPLSEKTWSADELTGKGRPWSRGSIPSWSRDSTMFATVCFDEGTVWSASDCKVVCAWKGPTKSDNPHYHYPVRSVDFINQHSAIAGDSLGYLSRIDLRTNSVEPLEGVTELLTRVQKKAVWAVRVAPGLGKVGVGRGDGSIEVWDMVKGRELARSTGHADAPGVDKWVECVNWFPGESRLCTWGGFDARLWNISW